MQGVASILLLVVFQSHTHRRASKTLLKVTLTVILLQDPVNTTKQVKVLLTRGRSRKDYNSLALLSSDSLTRPLRRRASRQRSAQAITSKSQALRRMASEYLAQRFPEPGNTSDSIRAVAGSTVSSQRSPSTSQI